MRHRPLFLVSMFLGRMVEGVPRVSVIIPAYNSSRTISRTLRSVVNQTFCDLEIVVVDDGSTDETAELVKSFADERIRLIRQENHGLSVTRNRGMQEAQGELFAFLDHDDLWTPGKLADQVAALDADPAAAAAFSYTCYIDDDDRLIGYQQPHGLQGALLETLATRNIIESGSNILLRRDAAEAVSGFLKSLENVEDWDYWLRLAQKHRFVLVPEYQVLYRQGSFNKSNLLQRSERLHMEVTDRLFNEDRPDLKHLRSQCLVNMYTYFAVRCFISQRGWQRARSMLGYLIKAMRKNLMKACNPGVIFLAVAAVGSLILPGFIRRWLYLHRSQKLERMPHLQYALATIKTAAIEPAGSGR